MIKNRSTFKVQGSGLAVLFVMVILMMAPIRAAEPATGGVELLGKTPAPPDNNEKGTIAAMLGVYSKVKSTVKWMNRCYQTYKGVVYTYEEIEYWTKNFDDYWKNVYDKFESAADNLSKGNVADAIFGLEDMFMNIDKFFTVEVQCLNYVLSRDLSRPMKGTQFPFKGACDYEMAMKVIEDIYDNSRNIRSLVTAKNDITKSRPSFEWYQFVASQAMQSAGKHTEKLSAIKTKLEEYKDINSTLQSLGENLAQQKLLKMSLYELEIMEFQLSMNDLEIQRNTLANLNNDIYRDIHNSTFEALAYEKMLSPTLKVDPYEKAMTIMNRNFLYKTGEVAGEVIQ